MVMQYEKFHTAGAGHTYNKLLFWKSQFSKTTYNSYQQYKPQNDRLELPYVVKTQFRALLACGACGRVSGHHVFIWGARRFQRAIARPNPTTIIQNRPAHYIYYYIDFVFISGNCITESGIPCSFPFYYQGIRYDSCTTVNDINDKHWCSIQTDTNGQHRAGTDTWGYCQLQSSIHCLPNK